MSYRLLILGFFLLFSANSQAQEVYLTLSGPSAGSESGDNRNSYDIWLKPESSSEAFIQLFDAAIGGKADFNNNNGIKTTTTYSLYHFDDLYEFNGNSVNRVSGNAEPLISLVTTDEQRYLSKWVNLNESALTRYNEGYILRVSSDEGDDINTYDIRLVNDKGRTLSSKSWKIITLDLSIALFESTTSKAVQVRAYNPNTSYESEFMIAGEEDSDISKIDSYGMDYAYDEPILDSLNAFGEKNSWGINVTGSKDWLNAFTVYGKNDPIMWLYEPILFDKQNKPSINIIDEPVRKCTEMVFDLVSDDVKPELLNNSIWINDGEKVGTGIKPLIKFKKRGINDLTIYFPNNEAYFPAYWEYSHNVFVNTPPYAKLNVPEGMVSPDKDILLSASSSYDLESQELNYKWLVNGVEVGENSDTYYFSASEPGEYSVSVVVNDGGKSPNCSNSQKRASITVNNEPYIISETFIRSNTLDVRLDASESYDVDGSPVTFEWLLPDGSIRNEASFTWQAPGPGIHFINLSIDDGGGFTNSVNSELIRVFVNQPAKAVVDPIINSCTGQPVLFNSSLSYDPDGDPLNAEWDFGDGNTSPLPNPTHRYEKAGVYTASLKLNDGYSTDTTYAQIPVIVEGSPFASIKPIPETICVNTKIQFDGRNSTDISGGLPSMLWDLGDGTTKSGGLVDHVYTKAGDYTITLTAEGSGTGNCSNIAQTTTKIAVIDGPTAEFTLPVFLTPKDTLILDGSNSFADGGFKSAIWTIQKDTTKESLVGLKQAYRFEEPGEYNITLDLLTNSETTCNSVSLTKVLKVNAAPVAVLKTTEKFTFGSDLLISGSSSYDPDGFISSYKLYFDDELISENASEIIKLTESGFHTIRLRVTDNTDALNNYSETELRIFVNAGPKPVIQGPISIYQSQSITLSTPSIVDADGDTLSSIWLVDGDTVKTPILTADTDKVYRVVLIQDDGRGYANSIDSAVVSIPTRKNPTINPDYPQLIIKGGKVDLSDINAGDDVYFINDNSKSEIWEADSLGKTEFTLGWQPEKEILYKQNFEITVIDSLRFLENPVPIEINEDVLKTVIKAPVVNRNPDQIVYTWKKDGELIGTGAEIEVSISKGLNLFTLVVTDLNVAYSQPLETEISVRVL